MRGWDGYGGEAGGLVGWFLSMHTAWGWKLLGNPLGPVMTLGHLESHDSRIHDEWAGLCPL